MNQNSESYSLGDGLRRGARYDSVFYGAFSGAGATFDIRVRLDLKRDLDLNKLQRAADDALKCYPEFAVRPVIKDGRICYEENAAPVALRPDDGTSLRFGTDGPNGTNGYLFVFLYGKRHITLSLFHAITDAHGLIFFLISVLWNYVKAVFPPVRFAGTKRFTKHGIRMNPSQIQRMGDTERYDPLTYFADTGKPVSVVDPEKIFFLPPETYAPADVSCRLINLEISNKAFLQKTKALGTSFAPLLAALTARAIGSAYDVGDRVISVSITADARKMLHTYSLGNMAFNCPLPLTKEELSLPLKTQCEKLRADMKKQITEENARNTFGFILSQCDQIDAMGDIIDVNKLITAPGGGAHLSTDATIFLTYPGRIGNNPISQVILNGVTPGMLAVERAVVAYAHKDSLIIQVTQKSDDLTLANALRAVLEEEGFSPVLSDMGRVTQNVLELETLKQIKN